MSVALDAACPYCKAQPGEPCRSRDGSRYITFAGTPKYHAKRGQARMASQDVTVTLTGPQVETLHAVLSMIEADPDWVAMIGGRQQMDTLYRAHNRILLARKAGR